MDSKRPPSDLWVLSGAKRSWSRNRWGHCSEAELFYNHREIWELVQQSSEISASELWIQLFLYWLWGRSSWSNNYYFPSWAHRRLTPSSFYFSPFGIMRWIKTMSVLYQNPFLTLSHAPKYVISCTPSIESLLPIHEQRFRKELNWKRGGIRLAHIIFFCASANRRFELKWETARKNVQMLNSLQDL